MYIETSCPSLLASLSTPAQQGQGASRLSGQHIHGPLIAETIFWGAFSSLIVFSAAMLIRDRPRNLKRLFMMAICVLMYAVATAHWAITVKWLHDVFEFVEGASATYEGVTPMKPPTFPDCTQTVLLAVNIILSDLVVLFRACTICTGNRIVRALSTVLFLALLGVSGYSIYKPCAMGENALFAAICTSWTLNVYATVIIAYKAWTHKRVVEAFVSGKKTRTRPEKFLMLLVDAGLLYCALWTLAMGTSLALYSPVISYLQNAALIQLVGMYPTILTTWVSFEKLSTEETGCDSKSTQNTRGRKLASTGVQIYVNTEVDVKSAMELGQMGSCSSHDTYQVVVKNHTGI